MKTVILSNFHIKKLLWIILRRIWLVALCGVIAAGGTYYFTRDMRTVSYYHYAGFFVSALSSEKMILVENGDVKLNGNDILAAKRMVSSVMEALQTDAVMSLLSAETGGKYTAEELSSKIEFYSQRNSTVIFAYVYGRTPKESYEIAQVVAECLPIAAGKVVGRGELILYDSPVYGSRMASTTSNKKYVLAGGAAGAAIPFLLFFIKGIRDPIIRHQAELEFVTDEEIIGLVQNKKRKKHRRKKQEEQIELFGNEMDSDNRNCYAMIRNRLFYEMRLTGCKCLCFVAPNENEGKFEIAVNVALSISETGRKVLLVSDKAQNDNRLPEKINNNLCTINDFDFSCNSGELSEEVKQKLIKISEGNEFDAVIIVTPSDEALVRGMASEELNCLYIGVAQKGTSNMIVYEKFSKQFDGNRDKFGGYLFVCG